MRKLIVGRTNMTFPQQRRASELTIRTQYDIDRQLSDARRSRINNPLCKSIKYNFLRKETLHPSPDPCFRQNLDISEEIVFSIMIFNGPDTYTMERLSTIILHCLLHVKHRVSRKPCVATIPTELKRKKVRTRNKFEE